MTQKIPGGTLSSAKILREAGFFLFCLLNYLFYTMLSLLAFKGTFDCVMWAPWLQDAGRLSSLLKCFVVHPELELTFKYLMLFITTHIFKW